MIDAHHVTEKQRLGAARPNKHPAPGYGPRDRAEEGRVGILFAALIGIVLILCLLAANISDIHMQHRRGLACADSVALAGSARVDKSAYFCHTCGGDRNALAAAAAHDAVVDALADLSTSTCAIGHGVNVEQVSVDRGDIRVAMQVHSTLVLIPPFVEGLVAPTIRVEGRARLVNP